MNSQLEAFREACAREVEWMARGHAAHEHVVLIVVVDRIRAIDLALVENGADIVSAAHEAIMHVRGEHPDYYKTCLDYADERIAKININDPMKPFSDKSQWWPRATGDHTHVS